MRHGERSGRRLGRVRDHVAPSAAAANTAVIAETEELPNGTQVIRFEADRPLLESARGMPEDEPPSDDDGEPEGPQRLHEITLVTERSSEEIERRLRQIRIDRFRTVLAPAMRDHGIGMFIYVLRLGRETVPGSDTSSRASSAPTAASSSSRTGARRRPGSRRPRSTTRTDLWRAWAHTIKSSSRRRG